jgi:spore maturation protein CgeB
MKILVVGCTKPYSNETACIRLFQKLGCDVFQFDNKPERWWLGSRSWWRLGRVARSLHDTVASLELVRTARRLRPDVLFLPKAENIHSRAVKMAVAATGARLITWYPDHPFKADMTSMNILRNLPAYDILYIWGRFLLETLHAAGARRAEYLPFAFDPLSHPENVHTNDDQSRRFSCEVCFVGTWDRERERDLAPLACFDLAIWGPGWPENLPASSPLRAKVRGGALYNEDLVRAYRGSSVVFNHLRLHNGSAHNVRSMEIAGIGGGAQLVRRTPELARELFTEDEHLLCFADEDEMKHKVRRALDTPETARRLSSAARQRVTERHLLQHRISRIVEHLRNLDAK